MAEANQNLVNLTINGIPVSVEPGTTVFNAGVKAGVFIPHYCYHPDLSIAGVCRMCMVEIEKNPRMQISCNTLVAEGMVVRTDTEKVKDTVRSVLELHLVNHPLDCPICDKAGECKLQDFYADYGLYPSRMTFEKVHKPKVVDIGTIVLDSERCILCTRCVRFTAEVTGTNELGIFNRGDRSTLKTYDGGPLKNEYTGNLADICPVGALTAKDFRFAQRVWFLEKTSSVCGLCAHGCNTVVSQNPNTQKLYRVEPRRNVEVNKSWICDTGRWDFHYVDNETRLRVPKERRADGVWIDSTWMEFFKQAAATIGAAPAKVLVGLSTHLTNEEVFDTVSTLSGLGVERFTWVVDESVVGEEKPYDGILKHRDLTPNAAGFRRTMPLTGKAWLKQADAVTRLKQGEVEWLFLVGLEGEAPGALKLVEAAPKTTKIVAHATTAAPWFEACAWVLPGVSVYEKNGTFVNAMGRLQKVRAAIPARYTGRDAHALAWGISRGHDREPLVTGRAQSVFDQQLAGRLSSHTAKTTWRTLDPLGVALEPNPEVQRA